MESITLPPDTWSLTLRLLLATALGGAIGLNREMSLKPAGLRTHALVALGAALVTLTGLVLAQSPGGDLNATSRVIQGIVAGIGFIGGGVILHGREDQSVHGLTTASSIWIVSAAGVAVGAGLWRASLIAVAIALVVLTVGASLDRAVHRIGFRDDKD
jgi:putative Mg2+ transporter-C (MgtC) family protein